MQSLSSTLHSQHLVPSVLVIIIQDLMLRDSSAPLSFSSESLFSRISWVSSSRSSFQFKASMLTLMRVRCSPGGSGLLSVSTQVAQFKLNWSRRSKTTSLIDGQMTRTKLSARNRTWSCSSSSPHKSRKTSTKTFCLRLSSRTSRSSSTSPRITRTKLRKRQTWESTTVFTLGMTCSTKTSWLKS